MEAPSYPTQEIDICVIPETESDLELQELKRKYWERRLFWRRNIKVSDRAIWFIAITIGSMFILIPAIILIVIFVILK